MPAYALPLLQRRAVRHKRRPTADVIDDMTSTPGPSITSQYIDIHRTNRARTSSGTTFAANRRVTEIPADVRELVRQRVPTMDHVEILMRLYEVGAPVTPQELARLSRLGPATVAKATAHLIAEGLVSRDAATGTFAYAASAGDRATVDALATMYNTKPVTLVKLVYSQPPAALQSFADAFRVVDKPKDE